MSGSSRFDLARPEKFALPCNPTIHLHLAYAVASALLQLLKMERYELPV
jgi:hypothetical protein